jgi:threonylcarbamoyladenosine tRNA methylthiotransferase CDKAL1
MSGLLDQYGYELVSNKAEADLWLVNSCTVKDPSEAVFSNLVKNGKQEGKKIVIAGCVPQGDSKIFPDTSVVGVHSLGRVVEVVEETLKGNTIRLLQTKQRLPSLSLPKIRRNRLIEIIPLSTGCLGSCTYCKTKHARGVLGSYPASEILKRVEQSIHQNVTEIWLSSEDTGAYGRDINETLPSLLHSITKLLDENAEKHPNVMLRVGMTNPPYILDHLDEISKILMHPRVFAWLHVPVRGLFISTTTLSL